MPALPPEIAAWIAMEASTFPSQVNPLSLDGGYGVRYLTVAQLKRVLNALKAFPFVRNHPLGRPRSFSNGRKQELIDLVHRYIYTDETCETVNPVALEALSAAVEARNCSSSVSETNSTSTVTTTAGRPVAYVPPTLPTTAPTAAYIPPASVKPAAQTPAGSTAAMAGRPVAHVPPASVAASIPQQSTNPYSAASRTYSVNNARKSFSGQKRQLPGSDMRHDYAGGATMTHASAAASNPSHHVAPPTAGVYVKGEYSLPEEVPRNDLERRILGTLQGMGFNDPIEILTSVRKLVAQQQPSTTAAVHPAFAAASISSDAVMFDIITTREEAEESKKMDEARRQSERSRKEEAERRRRILEEQYQQQLENGTIEAWKADPTMFPKSWILQDATACQVLEATITGSRKAKMELIALLKMEKHSLKWFKGLPRAYFVDCIVPRICASSATSSEAENTAATSMATEAPAWLLSCVESLQHVLYNLTQQNKNGVPLVFLEAHDAGCLRNPGLSESNQGVHNDNDDDDCVVVVVDVPAAITPESSADADSGAAKDADLPASLTVAMHETIDLTGPSPPPSPKIMAKMPSPPEIIEILL